MNSVVVRVRGAALFRPSQGTLTEYLKDPSNRFMYKKGKFNAIYKFPVECKLCKKIFEGTTENAAVGRIEQHARTRKHMAALVNNRCTPNLSNPCQGILLTCVATDPLLAKVYGDLKEYWPFHAGSHGISIVPQFSSTPEGCEATSFCARASTCIGEQLRSGETCCLRCRSVASHLPLSLIHI